jgi:uncharacterized protein YecE (DUF72 family)
LAPLRWSEVHGKLDWRSDEGGALRLHLGTSGFAYKEWRGSFYPEGLRAEDMLGFYAGRFSSVEINNTFYRMPSAPLLEKWSQEVPDGFDFVLKAPRRITHVKRLREVGDDVRFLVQVASTLGSRLGPLFYQLPPTLKKDLPLLRELLAASSEARRAAFEFRHPSWMEEDTWSLLHEQGAALCLAESDEDTVPSIPAGGSWGYLRLRRMEYTDEALTDWVTRVRSQPWSDVWVFFKHEDAGHGPALAARFLERWEG